MALKIKYYSFEEADTSNLSKGYGWSYERVIPNRKIRLVEGTSVVLKDESITRTVTVIPKGNNVKEISESEFKALDVSKELISSSLKREANARQLKRLKNPDSLKPISTEEVSKRFQAFHKKDLK